MRISILFILSIFLFNYSILASGRVLEVENYLRSNAKDYLSSSYPNTKFSIEVKVTPRFSRVKNKGNTLPFFNVENTSAIDPWKDSNRSLFDLLGRVRKVNLKINFLERVNISNKDYFKDRTLRSIGLVPGRDSVEISIEESSLIQKNLLDSLLSENNFSILFFGMFFFSLILISYVLFRKNIFSSNSADKKVDGGVSVQEVSNRGPSAVSNMNSNASTGRNLSSESVTLSDPTSSLEIIKDKISEINSSGTFPNLSDMVILNKLVQDNERAFSFLLFEFSKDNQEIILQNGKGDYWYRGFCIAGALDREIFFTLDTMLRNRDFVLNREFEDLLIQCWRMEGELSDFLKNIDRKHSLSILSFLPKYLSVPVAREAFPGAWGEIIADEKNNSLSDTRIIQNYLSLARDMCPLLNKESLDLYKNRRDLLSYLKVCEVFEEEEVYKVLGEKSHFFNVRPPFYKFFDLDNEDMRRIIDTRDLQEWSIILFNIRRDYRVKFNNVLSDKEKYLLGVYLKDLDSSPPSVEMRGELREYIGKNVNEMSISNGNLRSIVHDEMAA